MPLTIQKLGAKVREQRLASGMTLADLGGLWGVSFSAVGDLERGRRIPALPTVANAALFVRLTDSEICELVRHAATLRMRLKLRSTR